MTKNFTINCLNIKTKDNLYSELGAVFHFSNYYGKNLDALLDCLRDLGDTFQDSNQGSINITFLNFSSCIKSLTEDFNGGIFSVFNFWKNEYSNISIKINFEL